MRWRPIVALLLVAGVIAALVFLKTPVAGAAGSCGGG